MCGQLVEQFDRATLFGGQIRQWQELSEKECDGEHFKTISWELLGTGTYFLPFLVVMVMTSKPGVPVGGSCEAIRTRLDCNYGKKEK